MESAGSWNLLTASLAVCKLDRVAAAWAFLVLHGLVRDAPGDSDAFVNFVREEIDRGPITGPSVAFRVARALEIAGIALPAGKAPDPWAKIAQERLKKLSLAGESSEPDERQA